jgi:hypothetical protein
VRFAEIDEFRQTVGFLGIQFKFGFGEISRVRFNLATAGPGRINFTDAHPRVEGTLPQGVTISVDWIFQWRESLRDGVYSVPGFLIISVMRFVGHRNDYHTHHARFCPPRVRFVACGHPQTLKPLSLLLPR